MYARTDNDTITFLTQRRKFAVSLLNIVSCFYLSRFATICFATSRATNSNRCLILIRHRNFALMEVSVAPRNGNGNVCAGNKFLCKKKKIVDRILFFKNIRADLLVSLIRNKQVLSVKSFYFIGSIWDNKKVRSYLYYHNIISSFSLKSFCHFYPPILIK